MSNSTSKNLSLSVNPYIISAVVYLIIGGLTSLYFGIGTLLDQTLIIEVIWSRVHFITIGTLLHIFFGLLPQLITQNHDTFNWYVWSILNSGFILFLIGRMTYLTSLMIIGGSLLFLANVVFIFQIYYLTRKYGSFSFQSGELFYLTGFIIFLLGIIIGTGIWVGWNSYLGIAVPLEVHIHANNWGLVSFVFVGIFFDIYSHWTDTPLKWPQSGKIIYMTMLLGAAGLIIGPWIPSNWFAVPGLIFHFFATTLFLLNIILPLRDISFNRDILHFLLGYIWFFAPVVVAPLVVFKIGNVSSFSVEALAPEALVYGWLLSASLVFLYTIFQHQASYLQQITTGFIHVGAIFLWLSIFSSSSFQFFYGLAYSFWGLATTLGITTLFLNTSTATDSLSKDSYS